MKSKKHISLTDIPHQEPFQAPEGYFEHLPSQIVAKTKAQTTKGYHRHLPLAMAAAAAISLWLVYSIWNTPASVTPASFDTVTAWEAMEYLETQELPLEEILFQLEIETMDWEKWLNTGLSIQEEWLLDAIQTSDTEYLWTQMTEDI
jgi:hypothetical protein